MSNVTGGFKSKCTVPGILRGLAPPYAACSRHTRKCAISLPETAHRSRLFSGHGPPTGNEHVLLININELTMP